METEETRKFGRWPLLLASITLIATALALDLTSEGPRSFAEVLLALGATAFGAFLYAEGARHREWWHNSSRPQTDGPDTLAPEPDKEEGSA